MRLRTLVYLLLPAGALVGCSGATSGGSSNLSGSLAFQTNAVFALIVPDGGAGLMSYQDVPGTTMIAFENARLGPSGSLNPGQSLGDLACVEFFPVTELGSGPALIAYPSLVITLVPQAGALSPGAFPAVDCWSLDAGLACIRSNVAGTADGGAVTIAALPAHDAGFFSGSFEATFGGQVLAGQFSAVFCPATQ